MENKGEMKILVTGVAGMIGSHLLDELMPDPDIATVIGLDDLSVGKKENVQAWIGHSKFKLVVKSILDKNLINEMESVDVVNHLAASKEDRGIQSWR